MSSAAEPSQPGFSTPPRPVRSSRTEPPGAPRRPVQVAKPLSVTFVEPEADALERFESTLDASVRQASNCWVHFMGLEQSLWASDAMLDHTGRPNASHLTETHHGHATITRRYQVAGEPGLFARPPSNLKKSLDCNDLEANVLFKTCDDNIATYTLKIKLRRANIEALEFDILAAEWPDNLDSIYRPVFKHLKSSLDIFWRYGRKILSLEDMDLY